MSLFLCAATCSLSHRLLRTGAKNHVVIKVTSLKACVAVVSTEGTRFLAKIKHPTVRRVVEEGVGARGQALIIKDEGNVARMVRGRDGVRSGLRRL